MMDYTLAIEGSTYGGSVALLRGEDVVAERTLVDSGIPSRGGREERVLPSVAECLDDAGIGVTRLARVVCGAGPGSFTSLRISASVAKGIAVGIECPMYAVSSLLLSVSSCPQPLQAGRYLAVLSAMREEWFAAVIDIGDDGSIIESGDAFIAGNGELQQVAAREQARLIGPGQEVESRPHATGTARLLRRIIAAGPVRVESWEPDYGRLAEAQVRWEAAHGRPLTAGA
jgi:tRNA threonylcarbamoyladenosine biosynthesis protein TsaB